MSNATPRKYDVLDQTCPSRRVLDLIADKWSVLVIYALASGTKRYSELEKKISGITQKMLTQTLRHLEKSALVKREVFPVVPPHVEYSLTPWGETLVEPLRIMCRWAETYFQAKDEDRIEYLDMTRLATTISKGTAQEKQ